MLTVTRVAVFGVAAVVAGFTAWKVAKMYQRMEREHALSKAKLEELRNIKLDEIVEAVEEPEWSTLQSDEEHYQELLTNARPLEAPMEWIKRDGTFMLPGKLDQLDNGVYRVTHGDSHALLVYFNLLIVIVQPVNGKLTALSNHSKTLDEINRYGVVPVVSEMVRKTVIHIHSS